MPRSKTPRMATCHPDQKHCAHGKCKNCYYRLYNKSQKSVAYRQQYMRKYRETLTRCQEIGRDFGVTCAAYDEKILEQGLQCDICKKDYPGGRSFDIDHNHATGALRGIVCRRCNF